ncbi:unnamed protein product [Euphydryas editha]|uniref:Uncharacterized protein n=1 Tax=Euphydryas editha TaxID=104508 RepID=A0AAU9UM09_EUPED|nr:unnamed protein product [Euphydryas editha]
MDKKGSHSEPVHRDRNRKRKFSGNRYTGKDETSFASTSAKKLGANKNFEETITPNFVYCILEFTCVLSAISSSVICKNCNSEVTFKQCIVRGLGFKISMECEYSMVQALQIDGETIIYYELNYIQ